MDIYRISPCIHNADLTGSGAAIHGGRWNSKGIHILYTASSASLALLETVVHLSGIPVKDYCIALLRIPDDNIFELNEAVLPSNWATYPAPNSLKAIGDQFIRDNKYLAIRVPSSILAIEHNVLINPNHGDFKKVKLVSSKKMSIDERLV